MSASTTRSPAPITRLGAPLRPLAVVPPAPRAPAGFSKVMARDSRDESMNDGSMRFVIVAFWLRDSRVVAEKSHPGGRLEDEVLKGHARCRTTDLSPDSVG